MRFASAAAGVDSTVLRLLAVGVALADVVERVSARRLPGLRVDDLRPILVRAADTVRGSTLLPPAEAAFLGSSLLPPAGSFQGGGGVELSESDLPALRELALDLIARYLAEESERIEPADPGSDPMQSAALQYAEALVRQEEILEDFDRAARDASSVHAALSGTDRARIEELGLYQGGRRLDSRLDSWEACVQAVERDDADLMFEEYENWLDVRDCLEDALSALSPAARPVLEARVAPLDERFLDATRAVLSSIRPHGRWRPQSWWWYRLPRRPGESFRQRLAHVAPGAAADAFNDTDRPADG